MGGVSILETMFQGTPQKVKQEALENLAKGLDILAPGCGFPPYTRTDNVRAMVQAAKEFKKAETLEEKINEFLKGVFIGATAGK
jgi:[methyl-Co(III) methanol-specific corrinoid protein]:coenzyme M methyltransferase